MRLSATRLTSLAQAGGRKTLVQRTIATILSATPGSHWWDMRYTGSSPQLYQDAAGTQPVTAVSQFLGLCLDKPSGTVQYGPELVVNGDFSNGTAGWTVGAGWEVSGGVASGAVGSDFLLNSGVVTIGKFYKVSWTNTRTSGLCRVFCGGVAVANLGDGSGVTGAIITATSTQAFKVWNFASFVGTIDNISVKEVIGTPLVQSTTTKRPQISARVNSFTKTEDFADPYWSKTVVTATNGTAPTPGSSALMASVLSSYAINASHFINSTFQSIAAGTHTVTFDVASSGVAAAVITAQQTSTSWALACFDLTTGLLTKSDAAGMLIYISSASQPLGSGVYRVSLTFSSAAANTGICIHLTNSTSFTSVSYGRPPTEVIAVGQGILVGRAQLEVSATATAYQRINTATDYDTVGFPALPRFDGQDDAMTTGAITLGANMDCFMVVRRDSDVNMLLVYGNDNTYMGVCEPAATTLHYSNAGSPTTVVDGVVLGTGISRAVMHAVITVGTPHIVELRNCNLSTWPSIQFAGYTGYQLNGSIPEVILCPALSDADRTIVRNNLASKYGIAL